MPPTLAAAAGTVLGAADAAFYPVFAVFVAAFVVLTVVTVRWAVRRDRAGRTEWTLRQQSRGPDGPLGGDAAGSTGLPPPQTNGHAPRRPGQKGRERNQPG